MGYIQYTRWRDMEKIYEVDFGDILNLTRKILKENGGKATTIKINAQLKKYSYMICEVNIEANGNWEAIPIKKYSTAPKIGDIK